MTGGKEDLPWECDIQIDWRIESLYLKVTPPLCNMLVKSTTEGVELHVEVSSRLVLVE